MDGLTGWLASIATIIGGLMVAANLGSRVTGWGFVALTLGSACWSINALQNQASSLLVANLVLAAVNGFGIWRYLGRRLRIEQGSSTAIERSATAPVPSLASSARLLEQPLFLRNGVQFGTVIDMMLHCRQQDLAYVVVAFDGIGGIGEELRALPAAKLRLGPAGLETVLPESRIRALPPVDPSAWPLRPDPSGNRPAGEQL